MKKSIETLVNEYNDSKIDKLTLVKGIYKAMNVSIRNRNNLKVIPNLYKKYNLENIIYIYQGKN